MTPLGVCRELPGLQEPSDPLAKRDRKVLVVRLVLPVAPVRSVLLDLQDQVERGDLMVVMDPL